jgi:hypothetical protein
MGAIADRNTWVHINGNVNDADQEIKLFFFPYLMQATQEYTGLALPSNFYYIILFYFVLYQM